MSSEVDLPDAPPLEVLRDIAAAAEAYEQLSSRGRRVHFGLDTTAGTVAIELRDLTGARVTRLSPSDALQLAAGHGLR